MLFDKPQKIDAVVKVPIENKNILLLPYRSQNFPVMGNINTKPKEYAVSVQLAQLIVVCNSCCKVCSAVATIVPSTVIINRARETIVKTIALRTSGFCSSCLMGLLSAITFCETFIIENLPGKKSNPATV